MSIVLVNEKAVTVDISTKEDEKEKPLAMGVAGRPAQLAELPRSEFDPELFPHARMLSFL